MVKDAGHGASVRLVYASSGSPRREVSESSTSGRSVVANSKSSSSPDSGSTGLPMSGTVPRVSITSSALVTESRKPSA